MSTPGDPRDDTDRSYTKPIGYVSAHELGRLKSGHDANLRSARFGPSALDGDIPVFLDVPAAVDVGAAQAETAQAAPTDDTTSREQYRRMFIAACEALGLVNEALGLDPDDGGAEPILAAIRDLKAAQAAPVVPAGYALIRSENGFSLRSPGGEQWLFQPSIGTGTSSHFVYEFLAAIAGTPGATHGN